MNNYVKPAIKLAIANGVPVPGSCTTTSSDIELIQSIVGADNIDKAFATSEGCMIPFDMYCKFTSSETGVASVFWS